jgi:uncharacterized linocin/CFP29 family protein
MSGEWLRRNAAPLSAKTWNAIDETAISMAKQTLVARRIADLNGPRGWTHVASELGTFRSASVAKVDPSVRFSVPDVMLLTEIRCDFKLSWAAIDIYERVGPTLEPDAIEEAARKTALAEDRLVLYGAAHWPGLLTSDKTPRIALSDWSIPGRAVTDLLTAVEKLDELGVKGPYEAVMSPHHYYAYLRTTGEGGIYPAAKQLNIVIERVHSSAVIEGAALFSTRGGDFIITIGGDFTVGYRSHDENVVHLFCVETVAAQVLSPEAVCLIRPD